MPTLHLIKGTSQGQDVPLDVDRFILSGNLNKTLELKALLPRIVDSLFQLFKQADRCFIILRDEASDKLIPQVIRTRRANDESNARFSKSIVRQCMDKLQALLSDDASH